MPDLTLYLPGPDQIADLETGALVQIREAPADQLARMRANLTRLRHQIDDASLRLDAELVERVDLAVRSGEITNYTVHLAGYEIKAPSPSAGGKVDDDMLHEAMLAQAEDLDLSVEAIEGAFEPRVHYKRRVAVFNTLARARPALNALLARHTAPPRTRRATVIDHRPPAINATAQEDIPA
jgi:hypothetical protein